MVYTMNAAERSAAFLLPFGRSRRKKKPAFAGLMNSSLFLCRSSYRAGIGAGAALDAGIGIDLKLAVAFADGGNGAFLGAGAAGHTFVTDRICHDKYLHVLFVGPLYNTSGKNASGYSKKSKFCC